MEVIREEITIITSTKIRISVEEEIEEEEIEEEEIEVEVIEEEVIEAEEIEVVAVAESGSAAAVAVRPASLRKSRREGAKGDFMG